MSEEKSNTRIRAEKRGRRAETMAAIFLTLKGYKILERRLKTKLGEIDLIAKRGNLLVMVEVKQRPDIISAHESLHPQSLKRIERAAHQYINARPKFSCLEVRYDAVFVLPGFRMKHVQEAWRPY